MSTRALNNAVLPPHPLTAQTAGNGKSIARLTPGPELYSIVTRKWVPPTNDLSEPNFDE
jgi:hypothetical protein